MMGQNIIGYNFISLTCCELSMRFIFHSPRILTHRMDLILKY
jgi:hypothetical protein